ncbi:MAG: flagellin [Myxococcota bacterium]
MATPLAVKTNSGSLTAQRNLSSSHKALQQSIGRLSSGLRISSAADNAAGMAISENMRAQQGGFRQAQRNANDGVSVLQTAESGYQSISDLLVRMRELAVQSANDSVSDTERGYLNTEYQDLIGEIDRISEVTEYNGISLLDGTAGTAGTMTFQVGTRNSANDQITIDLVSQSTTALNLNSGGAIDSVSSLGNAQSAITKIDAAMESLSTDRATLGSTINTLNSAVDNLSSTIENYGNSLSQIRDTDMAEESAQFSKSQVMQQAGVAMLSQANAQPNLVLRLLG